MNAGWRKVDPQSGPTGSSQAATPRTNRLRRSHRHTQTAVGIEPPKNELTEFKTPTRIPRPKTGGVFSVESPCNDSDFQQDIIWDATSPSPNRPGKRGKKPTGVVNISEIVSRIAPKYGRPKVVEPSLQQWIGDTIPCTPDVQVPKPKKRSPRPNGVDDLLKLAQQFDFNLFHQGEEEEVEDLHQQSLQLLPDDSLDFENDFPPSIKNHQPDKRIKHTQPDLQMEDDLDFLFDGPTQQTSRNFSQVSQEKLPPGVSANEAPVKASEPSHRATNVKGVPASNEFEDDWENDDILNDSLVLEMTQNPQIFAAPRHCSTQKPLGQIKDKYPTNIPVSVGSSSAKVEKKNARQRSTFKLTSNPHFSPKRSQTDTWTNSKVDYSSKAAGKDTQQDKFGALEGNGSQCSWQKPNTVRSDPQKTQFKQRTSVSNVKYSTTSAPKPAPRFPQSPAVASSRSEAAVSDFLDEDLNSFFSSDPIWDDPADDDLLCEMCEDVENQVQKIPTKQIPPISTSREALQPTVRTRDNGTKLPANQKPFTQKQTHQTPPPSLAARGSHAHGFVSNAAAGVQIKTDSFRNTQNKNTSGSMNSSAGLQASSRVLSSRAGNFQKDQFTFKRPSNLVSTASDKVLGKCSAAEIELKKQQAMERRRQRLQAAQNP
ncbi:ewing's tumor-associated antigen 1-like [Xyrichtys novacula]|uniref:Ewing's tumor-associated antigen 1-like n=1 Tax=Xyrichtys novacula TaxID=13765 RepID=A0AAV1EWH2_XYRNO|nr:ewing's tumor-associated antigen 1-like [Xyrichtys novacula]